MRISKSFIIFILFGLFIPASIPNPLFSIGIYEFSAILALIGLLDMCMSKKQQLKKIIINNQPLIFFSILFFFSIFISIFLSEDTVSSIRGLIKWLFGFIIFYFFFSLHKEDSLKAFTINAVLILSSLTILIGILTYFIIPSWSSFMGYRYFNLHPNSTGQLFFICTFLSSGILKIQQKTFTSFLLFLLGFTLVVLSSNKTAIFLSLIALPFLLQPNNNLKISFWKYGLFAVLGFSIIFSIIYLIDETLYERLIVILSNPFAYRTILSRIEIWENSLFIISSNPLGIGPYNIDLFLTDEFGKSLNHPHNIILQILLETGWLGLFSFLGFLSLVLISVFRFSSQSQDRLFGSYAKILAAISFGYFILNNMSGGYSATTHLLYWSLLGIALFLKEDSIKIKQNEN